ncbi:MAG TPA: halocarboxylic acid dehydrogenase DehI family protein [Myxococcales bacterium]|nr:halocarboxylic acid dehydrogenase DehI family protein [Myxococcales bacterium]
MDGGRPLLREVQDALGIPWVPETWVELSAEPQVAAALWTRLRPVAVTGAFLRESLSLLSLAFADLADQYGAGEGVALPEGDRRGILLDLDALLYGNAQLLLLHSLVSLAMRDGAVGRPSLTGGQRPRSAYRRRVLEAVDESAAPADVRRLFDDVRSTLGLPAVPEDVRVVAKWMGFLEPAWGRLKRWHAAQGFEEASRTLERRAEAAARRLGPGVTLGDMPDGSEVLERWVEAHAMDWPSLVLMDTFFRAEAAVHPERRARASEAGEAQRL